MCFSLLHSFGRQLYTNDIRHIYKLRKLIDVVIFICYGIIAFEVGLFSAPAAPDAQILLTISSFLILLFAGYVGLQGHME